MFGMCVIDETSPGSGSCLGLRGLQLNHSEYFRESMYLAP